MFERFEGQLRKEDIDDAKVVIFLGNRAVVGVSPDSNMSMEDVADALHILSHKIYVELEKLAEEAEKN